MQMIQTSSTVAEQFNFKVLLIDLNLQVLIDGYILSLLLHLACMVEN